MKAKIVEISGEISGEIFIFITIIIGTCTLFIDNVQENLMSLL